MEERVNAYQLLQYMYRYPHEEGCQKHCQYWYNQRNAGNKHFLLFITMFSSSLILYQTKIFSWTGLNSKHLQTTK